MSKNFVHGLILGAALLLPSACDSDDENGGIPDAALTQDATTTDGSPQVDAAAVIPDGATTGLNCTDGYTRLCVKAEDCGLSSQVPQCADPNAISKTCGNNEGCDIGESFNQANAESCVTTVEAMSCTDILLAGGLPVPCDMLCIQ